MTALPISLVRRVVAALCLCTFALGVSLSASAQTMTAGEKAQDPRVGLKAGWQDAESAAMNMELVAHVPRPDGFFNPDDPGDFSYMNSDFAFRGDHLFLGSFHGLQIWNIADPSQPTLRLTLPCPGGQGDVSVHGDLLFMSVEETRGRLDCGPQGVSEVVSDERFRGVRVYDISDVDRPKQVAAVQTCRGSHTHTLVPDVEDDSRVFIYVSGTSQVRPSEELPGCSGRSPDEDPNTSLFRIEVIEVPLDAPQDARIVSTPRIFADATSGDIAGLWPGGPHGEGTQETSTTNQCHDITVYPELGLAAGACSGNGILLDISDPANPKRIDEVIDPNFAYWHSATFNNDGSTVLFTDEWGGGLAPRCRDTDRPEWGANAIFTLEDGELEHASYYKLPAPQTSEENCVAHNGSLVPIPGRDVMAQAWYQGGVSVLDFTDPANPQEIAYFDRGPMNAKRMVMAGYWSVYWYNGYLYASEIGRGLDVFKLTPSEHVSQNEIDAAESIHDEEVNPQLQTRIVWPASFSVARAYLDQLARHEHLTSEQVARVGGEIDQVEQLAARSKGGAAVARLASTAAMVEGEAGVAEAGASPEAARRLRLLAATLRELGGALP
ncbi:MAG: hypothetical protein ABJF88_00195 [Rhodothermales bacterium]